MLNKLTIKNVALIEVAEIDFSAGLNVMSGETGSGKSIILESLNFVLGAKTDKTLIKHNENECFVSAEFNVSNNSNIKEILEDFDIEYDDTLLLSRKLTIDGKNSIKINGQTVNLTMLKKITSHLVDVHGQSEHYNLLSNANQLKLIDTINSDEISKIKDKISNTYIKYKEILDFLEKSGGDERQRQIKLDVLNFQINEIETANVYDGEEDELLDLKLKLLNQEKILNALGLSKASISEEGGLQDILYNAIKALSSISDFNDDYKALSDRLNDVYAEITDLENEISFNIDNFNTCDSSLDEVNERLNVIKNIKKKYGDNYNEIIAFLDSAIKERDNLINYDKICSEYIISKSKIEKNLYESYLELNKKRKEVSEIFTKNVVIELKKLGMPNANFVVNFNDFPNIEDCDFTKNGPDKVEFMFSANLGEALKPLSYVISGGEMSRFMLAIKVQSSISSDVSTYIFDEIDAGIGGATAEAVGERLSKLAKNVQVLVVTHSPQVASFGDEHFRVEKNTTDNVTTTKLIKLTDNGKLEEIALMLAGEKITDEARAAAKVLLNKELPF